MKPRITSVWRLSPDAKQAAVLTAQENGAIDLFIYPIGGTWTRLTFDEV